MSNIIKKSLFTIIILLGLANAQDSVTFRVGTLNQIYENSVPAVGTFAVFYTNEAVTLNAITTPDGNDLFEGNFQPSTVNFLGTSPLAPQAGNYLARYTADDISLEATASLSEDFVLPIVENVALTYLNDRLNVS